MTKTDIVRMDKGGEKTKYAILAELIDIGLIKSEKEPEGRWNSEHLYLTENGLKIAEYIENINQIMGEISI